MSEQALVERLRKMAVCVPFADNEVGLPQMAEGLAEAATRIEELEKRDPRILRCAFCHKEYPPGTPATQNKALTAHILSCAKHPLRARIAELEAIVEKLPKTTDGVPVVPGMRLFCTHNRTVTVQSIDQPDDPDDESFITVWDDSGKINATDFVYSTRAAAEQAAKE